MKRNLAYFQNCFIAANVIKTQNAILDKIPSYVVLHMDTTCFSHRFSDNEGADMQVSILSISILSGRFDLQSLWAIW